MKFVSPAPAGMIPTVFNHVRGTVREPRTRGDDPQAADYEGIVNL